MSGLKPPRRKRRVYQQLDSPFPVPIESITKKPASASRWFYYTALLQDNCVLVQREGDLIFLYKMGFFGKGMLSKSKPEHGIFLNSYQGLRKKNLPPKERRFQQQRFQQVRKNRYERHLSWSKQFVRQCRKLAQEENQDAPASEEIGGDQRHPLGSSEIQGGNGEECTNSDGVSAGTDDVTAESDDTKCEDITDTSDDLATSKSHVTTRTDDVTTGTDDVTTGTDDVTTGTDDVTTGTDDVTTGTDDVTTRTYDVTTKTDDVTTRTDDVTTRTDDVTTRTDDITTRTDDITTRTDDVTTRTDDVTTRTNDATTRIDCVTTTTQEETEDQGLIRKEDPYQIHEYLQLKLEEAFFLSYGLGCLTVMDETKKALDLTEMWQAFCSRQRNFVASYVAYHYYRSKGWVPRDGIKYGTHYVLYKHGPPFYHGSYSVIVQMVTEGSWDSSDASTVMTWPALSGMDRITETVAKEVMFCYVIRPADLSDQDLRSPKCIPRFRVQEIHMRRWVSSRERDAKDQLPPLIS